MHWESVEKKTEILLEMTLRGHHPKVDKNELDNNYSVSKGVYDEV